MPKLLIELDQTRIIAMITLGVDVGGTFTDLILTDSRTGRTYVHKVPSTPESQDKAVVKGISEILEEYSINPNDIHTVVHGTTVATNAMLQRNGANVCLITTAGLEDVLEIGRQDREEIYSINATRPRPLVKEEDRLGVQERLDSNGNIITPLHKAEIYKAVDRIKARGPQAVAVSFLFSFANPEHEKAMTAALKQLPDVYIAASSEVLPEFREFERTSTTVLEAYLGPLVLTYLNRLDSSIDKICPNSRFAIMQSNGGTVLCSQTEGRAVGLAISGLAGGVIGGWQVASAADVSKAITLDMGGTSCDISAVSGGITLRPDNEIAGLPLRTRSVDVKTIGAGGGSIAWIDSAGILHVGPQSAGAIPGPAAYAMGGTHATVTDANLVLGRFNPEYFVGGQIKLQDGLASSAIASIGKKLNLSIRNAALGIIRISTSNMVQAIREVTVERGRDPRDFILVPFGGAGPTQAVDIADALGIHSILVPRYPGITSAYGLVCANLRVDLMKTVLLSEGRETEGVLSDVLRNLTARATNDLLDQGASSEKISVEWSIDMRYSGQSHELNVEISPSMPNLLNFSKKQFEEEHRKAFGYSMRERDLEWVTVRVAAIAEHAKPSIAKAESTQNGEPVGAREILVGTDELQLADVYRRETLASGQRLAGPSLIEQLDTTVYVGPDWTAEQQGDGTLWIRRPKS